MLTFLQLLSPAQASYPEMAGYFPETNVVPHSKVDLDMAEIVTAVASFDWTEAGSVFSSGGCGTCSAEDVADESSLSCYQKSVGDPKGCSIKGSGAIRTIQGFATSGRAKMTEEKWWPIYRDYWNDDDYSNTFVLQGLTDDTLHDQMRSEMVKKGAAYQSVWMYVLHEFEDAIMDCKAGNVFNNDHSTPGDAPTAWDEGWAFYAGSLEGTDGTSSGQLLYELAQKRCKNFGTCVDGLTGNANVNVKMLERSQHGLALIMQQKCDDAAKEFEAMVDLMTIPLVQGTLRYAYKADPANTLGSCTGGDCPKEWAEGWAFAAAVLPRINQCDASAAQTVRRNFDVVHDAPVADGFGAVKTALESVYECMGIKCADVGALQSSAGVFEGMEMCEDPKKSSDSGLGTGPIIGIIVGCIVALALVAFLIFKACSQPPAENYKEENLVN